MIKKLKNNIKALNRKGNSLLDFVKHINENIKHLDVEKREPRRKVPNNKSRSFLPEIINGQENLTNSSLRYKIYVEDKENICKENSKLKSYTDKSIKTYFNTAEKANIHPIRMKKIEFYDELNRKNIKMIQFEEKDVKFTQSKILPKVKFMKVDNDVMTDDEQIKDGFKMMRNDLKETIKFIDENKEFLKKNLSRKIKFAR